MILGVYLEIRIIPVLLWSYSAVTLGTAIAWRGGGGSVPGYLVALLEGLLLQGLVAHTVNEIADWQSGTDQDPAPRVISGGSKVVASGLLTLKELKVIGLCAGALAVAIGIAAAATWGWVLLFYGALGLAGAVLYTVPPVRAAYRPLVGEGIALVCVWACAAGAFVLQRGTLTGEAALAGVAHAAACVGMLMLHHSLDRGPDSRALPPKVTTVVRMGDRARAYRLGWAVLALALSAALVAGYDAAFWPLVAGAAVALVAHLAARDDDPASVTRAELVVILAGMGGALGSAVALSPVFAWALVPPAVLVPAEILLSGAAHRALLAERAERYRLEGGAA